MDAYPGFSRAEQSWPTQHRDRRTPPAGRPLPPDFVILWRQSHVTVQVSLDGEPCDALTLAAEEFLRTECDRLWGETGQSTIESQLWWSLEDPEYPDELFPTTAPAYLNPETP